MSIPVFDVALEVSKLKSPPANSANPAKVEGGLATLATLAEATPRLEAVQPHPPISSFSNFSSPPPRIRQIERASAPASGTAPTDLGWLPGPPDEVALVFNGWWAAFDLADVCRLYGVRVAHAGERILAIYPPALEAELVAYAGSLLVEAQDYLRQHIDRLPNLPPGEAGEIVKDVMRAHPGLKFCRGEAGSLWPIYPRTWTAGQRATLQSLWHAAGDALDQDDFKGIDAACSPSLVNDLDMGRGYSPGACPPTTPWVPINL